MSERTAEGLGSLVRDSTEVELVAGGFEFTEGPVWDPGQGALLFSDMPGDKRRRWHPQEGITVVREPSNMGNGMTFDADGALVVCEHATSSIVREDGEGRWTMASHWDGRELNSPNDVIVADDGSVLFTDPTYGRLPYYGVEREVQQNVRGVYRIPADGGALELLVDDCVQPNGLCLSPGEGVLYINDTDRAHVRAFEVGPGWSLRELEPFATQITGSPDADDGFVDGMKCDEHGNVYVTGPGGIWVYAPDGVRFGVIEVPEKVGNLNWGDDDWSTLYITASSSLYRIRMRVAGNRLGYMR